MFFDKLKELDAEVYASIEKELTQATPHPFPETLGDQPSASIPPPARI